MLLTPEDADLLFRLHRTLMFFVNQRLEIVADIGSPDELSSLSPETRLRVRDAFLEHVDLIESFVSENPAGLPQQELEIVGSWRDLVAGRFIIFRQLKKHAILLSLAEPQVAYGVLAATEPLELVIGPGLPYMADAVLLPFQGRIVYDGLLRGYNASFGPGFRRRFHESYKTAKERQGVVTALPAVSTSPSAEPGRARKAAQRKTTRSASEEVRPVLEIITGLTDQFCREQLNDEYAGLCRKLAEKLARKRPSPLLSGRPTTWACGIARTIGWVNFLDSRSHTPHMKLTEVDRAFGVGESTGQGKSKAIRKMLKIRPFEPEWTLPSRIDENPRGWMHSANGLLVNIGRAP